MFHAWSGCGGTRREADPGSAHRASGFTLLEIMLVLAIVVVVLAIVAPRFTWAPAASLVDEAQHFRRLLAYAREEAELGGVPLRCTVLRTGYRFSRATPKDGKEAWMLVQRPPLTAYRLPDPLIIQHVRMSGMRMRLTVDNSDVRESTVLAHLFFYPDGSLSPADVVMAAGSARMVLRLRPGPGGISVEAPGS